MSRSSVRAWGLQGALVEVLWNGSGKGGADGNGFGLILVSFCIKSQEKILPSSVWWLFGVLWRGWGPSNLEPLLAYTPMGLQNTLG